MLSSMWRRITVKDLIKSSTKVNNEVYVYIPQICKFKEPTTFDKIRDGGSQFCGFLGLGFCVYTLMTNDTEKIIQEQKNSEGKLEEKIKEVKTILEKKATAEEKK